MISLEEKVARLESEDRISPLAEGGYSFRCWRHGCQKIVKTATSKYAPWPKVCMYCWAWL